MNLLTAIVFNCGSSSLKFGLFQFESAVHESHYINKPKVTMLVKGVLEFNANSEAIKDSSKTHINNIVNLAQLTVLNAADEVLISESIAIKNQLDAVLLIVRKIAEFNMPAPVVVGHRVVHSGPTLLDHCLINDEVLQQLKLASTFAPVHQKNTLSLIALTKTIFPHLPQVACFDTVFHADLPIVASTLPLTKKLSLDGLRRYGFHGLSCESIVDQLGEQIPQNLIIAHLGHGASITAVKNGKSIDTTMGLTPSGGLMMGSRCGDIDPEILIYLIREKKFDAAMLETLFNYQSGLLGVSELSSDLRDLRKVANVNAAAQLAIDMFCYIAAKQIAGMMAALKGIDMIVFTGGIGENDSRIRSEIVNHLNWAGVVLDERLNQFTDSHKKHPAITNKGINHLSSIVKVLVISSQEEKQIACHARTAWHHFASPCFAD